MLTAQGVSVRHGPVEAVIDAAITVPRGMITALVGPNGVGKTSLIQALIGTARRASGTVRLDGVAIDRLDPPSRSRAGLAVVPQGRQVFPHLTVWENLRVMADAVGLPAAAVAGALQRFPILDTRRSLPAGVLSGGEQQMLALARALMLHPKVLLLDEPSLGLAPLIVEELIRTITALAADGMAVLVAEPSIRFIRGHIDRGYVMLRGRVVAEATGATGLEAAYLAAMSGGHAPSA